MPPKLKNPGMLGAAKTQIKRHFIVMAEALKMREKALNDLVIAEVKQKVASRLCAVTSTGDLFVAGEPAL